MSCPPDDALRRLIRDEPDATPLVSHLDDCRPCQERLAALAGGAGTWAAVRHLSAADTSDVRTTPAGSTLDRPTPPRPAPTPPPELADHPRYRILDYLGGGGMGEVWLATHTLMNKTVALKVIRPALVRRPGAVERFRQEVRAAGRLNHPNVAQAHDADQIDDLHFLVMEYAAGVNLEDEVAANGPLRVRAACDAVRQVAAALQHAHAAGVTHRDIKPSNLVRTAGGVVKVLDFGIARLNELADAAGGAVLPPTRHTADGAVMGTYDFISPEQGRNARDADIRSDLYSLGCTLYYLLTGRVVFPGGDGTSKLARHATERPPRVTAVRRTVPAGLAHVMDKLLAKNPNDRYQTPAELSDALRPFGTPERTRVPWRGLLVAGLAAAVLTAGTFGVYYFATDQGELVIESDDPQAKVMVRRNWADVGVVDAASPQTLRLRSGEYQLSVVGDAGLKLSVNRVTLGRGDRVTAKVYRPEVVPPAKPVKIPVEPVRPTTPAAAPPPSPLDGWEHAAVRPEVRLATLLRCGKLLTPYGFPLDQVGRTPAFHPDGEHLLCPEGDRVSVWNLHTGRRVRQFASPAEVANVCGCPERKSVFGLTTASQVIEWNWESGAVVRSTEAAATATADGGAFAVFANGSRVAVFRGGESAAVVLSWPDAKEVARIPPGDPRPWGVSFAVRPDGKQLAIGCSPHRDVVKDGKARLLVWDLTANAVETTVADLRHPAGGVVRCAYDADGKRLAVGTANEVRVWAVGAWDKKPTAIWTPGNGLLAFDRTGDVLTAAVSPNAGARPVISPVWGGLPSVSRWSATDGGYLGGFAVPAGELVDCKRLHWAVSPDGRTVAVDRSASRVYSPEKRELVPTAGSGQAGVLLYDLDTGESAPPVRSTAHLLKETLPELVAVFGRAADVGEDGGGGNCTRPAFSPDGRTLIGTGLYATVCDLRAGGIRSTGTLHVDLPTNGDGPPRVTAAAVSPNGLLAVIGDSNGVARVFNLRTRTEVRKFPRTDLGEVLNPVVAVAFLPDGQSVAVLRRELHVCPLAGGPERVFRDPKVAAYCLTSGLAVHPNGRLIATGASNNYRSPKGVVAVWDVGTGGLLAHFQVKRVKEYAVSVAFNRDGSLLAAGTDGGYEVRACSWGGPWAEKDLSAMHEGEHPAGGLLAFHPDGRSVWTAAHRVPEARVNQPGRRVVRAALADGKELAAWTFAGKGQNLLLTLSPDGRRVAGGCEYHPDGHLWLIDTATGRPLVDPETKSRGASRLTFTRDGRTLLTSGYGTTQSLWYDTATGKVSQRILTNRHSFMAFAVSPDGGTLAAAGGDTVHRYDTRTGQPTAPRTVTGATVRDLKYHPGGRFVAALGDDGGVFLIDSDDKQPAVVLSSNSFPASAAEFDRTGQKLVTLHAEGVLRVWDVPTATQLWSHRVPALSSRPDVQPPVGPVVGLPDNSGFVVGTTDGRVVQVNWAAAETVGETKAIDDECTALAVSPDGRRLAVGGRQTLAVFDRTAGGWRRRAVYPLAFKPGLTTALEFAPDGRHLAAGTTDGAVLIFRLPPAGKDAK